MKELVIGADIGGTKIHFALVDETGQIAEQHIVPTEAKLGAANVLNKLIAGIEKMHEAASRYPEAALVGIGVGSAGQIDFASGSVAFAVDTLPGWTGTQIKAEITSRFPGLPVYVDNDVNVIAVAEKYFGSAKHLNSFVCLALGTGVGGATMEDGKLIRGAFGGAGELGHVSVNFSGPRCSCGNYGCLELYASGTGIGRIAAEVAAAHAVTAWEPNSRAVIEAWRNGDPHAKQVIDTVISALSAGIAGFIHTFNPQAVIIGGGVSEAGEPFFTALREATAQRTASAMWKATEIVPATVGVNAGVIGAAAQLWYYE